MNSLEQDVSLNIITNDEVKIDSLTNVNSIVTTSTLEQDIDLNANVSINNLSLSELDNVSNINASLYNYISGSGGSNDYNVLSNKPKINDVVLQGNKTSSQLGLQDTIVDITNSEINNLF